jgi:hypothetical protein
MDRNRNLHLADCGLFHALEFMFYDVINLTILPGCIRIPG